MDAAIGAVGLAGVVFLISHLGLAHESVRDRIVGRIGEKGFQGLYGLTALLALSALIAAYAGAPHHVYLWIPGHGLRHVPLLAIPMALILIVGGMMTPNPSAVGMESRLDEPDPAKGILRITRHPVMWGVALWAAVHILANGDWASLLFFGALLLTAVLGSLHLDRRMAAVHGERWRRFAAVTSYVPFAAIVGGRQPWSWRELLRPALIGLGVFATLLLLHPYLFGVRPY